MGSTNFTYDEHLSTTYVSGKKGYDVGAVSRAIEKANSDLKYGQLVLRYGYHEGICIHSILKINERYKYTGDVERSISETADKLVDDMRYIVRSIEAKTFDEMLDTTDFLKKVIKDLIENSTQYGVIKPLNADEMFAYALECNKTLDYDMSDEEGREDLVGDAFRWKFWYEACTDGYDQFIEKMDEAAKKIADSHGMHAL